jgi:hypothetical protein
MTRITTEPTETSPLPTRRRSMQTFDTPEPISVTLEIGVGDIRITADERTDTIVEVRPSNPSKKGDVTAAEQTSVEYSSGRLLIKAPKGWRHLAPWRGSESIDVRINLPIGSHLHGEAAVATLHSTGRLGECRYKTSVGDINLDQAEAADVRTVAGDLNVNRVLNGGEFTAGSGAVWIGAIDGSAVVKNSNGDTWIGRVGGDLRVNAANGRIVVDHSRANVMAKTAYGEIRLGEVAHGAIVAETAYGAVDIGIRAGVPAWLDLSTSYGTVRNELDDAERPDPDEDAVEVRAQTSFGNITVRRPIGIGTEKEEA